MRSLFYERDIRSDMNYGVLQVYHWTGPIKLGTQHLFFPELFVETDKGCFENHVTLESVPFSKRSNL